MQPVLIVMLLGLAAFVAGGLLTVVGVPFGAGALVTGIGGFIALFWRHARFLKSFARFEQAALAAVRAHA